MEENFMHFVMGCNLFNTCFYPVHFSKNNIHNSQLDLVIENTRQFSCLIMADDFQTNLVNIIDSAFFVFIL